MTLARRFYAWFGTPVGLAITIVWALVATLLATSLMYGGWRP